MIRTELCRGPSALPKMLVLVLPMVMAAPAAHAVDVLTIEGPVAAEYAVRPVVELASLPTVPMDIDAARAEDEPREAAGLPPRFAISESTWLTPESGGTWEELDRHHLLWRARITAPGALSLNLGFTGYRLPKGARLSLYPADVRGGDDIRGLVTFTAADNEDHGELWTPVILADDIVVELVLPKTERDNYVLELTAINKGYRYFGEDLAFPVQDKQGTCNVDVVCSEGDPWRAEVAAVGAISTGGAVFCTGVMMNNTAQDGTPYFLTANHCGVNAGNAASLVVYWNFESPNCGDLSGGLLTDFQTGATHLASSTTSDFTLVLLDDMPAPAAEVSFAGWDNAASDPGAAVAIHHPSGDEKAISFENDPTSTTSYLRTTVPGDGTHLRVTDWDLGTTEPGSSGSPLFDPNHRVVGQLHGGYAACGNNESDWYGRLSVSWVYLAPHLDPLTTGQQTLDTYAPWMTGMQVSGAPFVSEGNPGGPFTPTSAVYGLLNNGDAAINYSVTADVGWLDVSPASGTLAPGATVDVTVTLNAAVVNLENGRYEGLLSFTNVSTGEGDTTQPVTLTVGLPQLVASWDLSDDPGWEMGGAWDWGPPLGDGGQLHGWPDPLTGYTGGNVLGYNLAGDYPANLPPTHLTSTPIDCSALVGTELRFWRWLNVEQPLYDHASVSVSTDGVNFTSVWENVGGVEDNAWSQQVMDISTVADGQGTVYLRWTMGQTDLSWEFSGWNIDDIEIWGVSSFVSAVDDVPGHLLAVDSYPNPFNPLTRIKYSLEREGHASVRVYDVQGRLVRSLVDGVRPAGPGQVVWDGTDADGQKVSSGVYFAQVVSGGKRAEHKMVLLK